VFDWNSSLLENYHAQNGEREQTAYLKGQRAKLKISKTHRNFLTIPTGLKRYAALQHNHGHWPLPLYTDLIFL
jgi:hypothetical protein